MLVGGDVLDDAGEHAAQPRDVGRGGVQVEHRGADLGDDLVELVDVVGDPRGRGRGPGQPLGAVQGQADPDVPWHRTVRLAELLRSADVQTWLVKDGDHRLSRDADIALLVRAVEDVIQRL